MTNPTHPGVEPKKVRPLVARLRDAARILKRDRQALYDSERRPAEGNTVDAEAAAWLAEYDDAIAAVAMVIKHRRAAAIRSGEA